MKLDQKSSAYLTVNTLYTSSTKNNHFVMFWEIITAYSVNTWNAYKQRVCWGEVVCKNILISQQMVYTVTTVLLKVMSDKCCFPIKNSIKYLMRKPHFYVIVAQIQTAWWRGNMNASTCQLQITQHTWVKSGLTTGPKDSMNRLEEKKNPLPPPGFEPQTVQPEASRYANYTFQAPTFTVYTQRL